jgi:phosphoglycerate dehydrogenase-like enzyme
VVDNTGGFAALDKHIARVEGVPGVAKRIAPDVSKDVHRIIVKNIAAGIGPDGVQWKPTKEGGAPLRNAARALTVSAVEAFIVMMLEGPEAKHHKGNARGRIKRLILPTRATVQPFRELARKAFSAAMSGGKNG